MDYNISEMPSLVDLFSGLLAIDPSKRFDSVDQILAHPYLTEGCSDSDSEMTELNQEIESSIKRELNQPSEI